MTVLTATPVVGQELPTMTWNTGLENWNRYAAVNDEFVPIHMDDAAGQAAGYPGAFGMGNLQWSYLHAVLRSWLADLPAAARIVSLECRFRAPNLRDTTVSAGGRVSEVRLEDERVLVDLEVWTRDGQGRQLAPGTAVVEISCDRKETT